MNMLQECNPKIRASHIMRIRVLSQKNNIRLFNNPSIVETDIDGKESLGEGRLGLSDSSKRKSPVKRMSVTPEYTARGSGGAG